MGCGLRLEHRRVQLLFNDSMRDGPRMRRVRLAQARLMHWALLLEARQTGHRRLLHWLPTLLTLLLLLLRLALLRLRLLALLSLLLLLLHLWLGLLFSLLRCLLRLEDWQLLLLLLLVGRSVLVCHLSDLVRHSHGKVAFNDRLLEGGGAHAGLLIGGHVVASLRLWWHLISKLVFLFHRFEMVGGSLVGLLVREHVLGSNLSRSDCQYECK